MRYLIVPSVALALLVAGTFHERPRVDRTEVPIIELRQFVAGERPPEAGPGTERVPKASGGAEPAPAPAPAPAGDGDDDGEGRDRDDEGDDGGGDD